MPQRNQDQRVFIGDALTAFVRDVDGAIKSLEAKWDDQQEKVLHQLDKLKDLEQRVKTATDTARVRTHLAAADLRDATSEIGTQIKTLARRLNDLKAKIGDDFDA